MFERERPCQICSTGLSVFLFSEGEAIYDSKRGLLLFCVYCFHAICFSFVVSWSRKQSRVFSMHGSIERENQIDDVVSRFWASMND